MTSTLQPVPKQLAPVRDVTRAVKLDFELRYVKCALAPKAIESHPMLQLFLGAQFERDRETGGIINVKLNEDDLSLRYVGSLVGTLKRDHREIPAATAIGIDSYAIHRNDFGHQCYVNCGTSYALLQDVLRDIKVKGAYEREHPLMMHTVVVTGAEPVEKGVISLRITQCEVGTALVSAMSAFIHAPAPALLQSNPTQVVASINAYIDATVALEQALQDTVPNTERMHAFSDISESGAQMLPGGGGGSVFLPIAAYALLETPRANEGFFMNAYERVMARRGLSMGAWHDFDVKEKARTMALMLCHGVQTFDYIGDAVEMSNRLERITQRRHVGNEEFSDIWNSLVGDCEDGARGIQSVYKAFIATPLTNPDLCEMQLYAKHYVALSTLSVVHGAKIGDQEGFGAHMYLPLFPRPHFERALSRTPEGKQFLERASPAVPLIGAPNEGADHWVHELPPLFCEGTGRIDPLGYRDPIFEQRRYVAMQLPSLGAYKKEIPREEGAPSTFYHANLLGITDQFVEQNGVPVAGFVFCQHNGAGKPITRGSLFTDFIHGSPTLAILPQPPVPPQIMAMIGEATALRPPARPMEFDARKPLSGPKSNRHLDALVRGINELGHTPPASKPAAAVQVVMRPHQISEAAVQNILHEARQSERLYAATYEVEQVTNEIHHFLVNLWVK